MPDLLIATDIQVVRLQLQLLCSRQSDPAVRYLGAIVDFNLAQALVRDDSIQRAELAKYVEKFRVALRKARSEESENCNFELRPLRCDWHAHKLSRLKCCWRKRASRYLCEVSLRPQSFIFAKWATNYGLSDSGLSTSL